MHSSSRISSAAAAAVAALLLASAAVAAEPAPVQPPLAPLPGQAVPPMGNEHIPSPGAPHRPYNSDPPTSGPHVRWTAKWGVHKTPVPLEAQVHNLEDGGVVIQYNCSAAPCPELVEQLEALFKHPELMAFPRAQARLGNDKFTRLVIAPYPTMKHRIALTAWGRIDTMDQYDEARILAFIKAYIGIDNHPATPN